jgi:2'-5' RNA ligase
MRLTDEFFALARQLEPFEIIIDGLGYFDSHSRVVFLQVRLTDNLRRVHQAVNEMLEQCCENLFQNYLPANWIPHVTVAMKDLTDQEFNRAMHDLREYRPYYRQTLSNINLVQASGEMGRIEIIRSVRLTQGNRND